MNKVYRINTRTKTVSCETLKKEYETFGNRGLIAKVLTEEVNPKCDPLGPENKLIISLGIFAGTNMPTCNRVSVGGKSPLTGGIKEANVGGTIGNMLSRHGIKMLIFEDQPTDDQWSILHIDSNGQVELLPAAEYVGLNNYALVDKLFERYGRDVAVLSIGLAGERLYKNSSMQATDYVTGFPSRAAARGGLGAVAGSKRIKAIVVEKPLKNVEISYYDRERFQNAVKKMASLLNADPLVGVQRKVGTPGLLVGVTAPLGVMPVRNFSGEYFEGEKLEKIKPEYWLEKFEKNGSKHGQACQPGCVVRCSGTFKNKKGEAVTAGLEYETVALCGANCDISDMDFITEVDRFCDDMGMDTIEFGAAVGVCMDVGKIPWGDQNAVKMLMQEVLEGTEFGNLLGQGTYAVGKALGAKRIPTAKKQAMPGYDPRNLKGTGVTYATSAMGADHTAGLTFNPELDGTKKDKQVSISQATQISTAMADNMMCSFAMGGFMPDPTVGPDLFTGFFGGEWDMDKIMKIGVETLKMEWAFNKEAGFTAEDDKLPDFFYEDQSPATGARFDITPEEIAEIYKL